MEGCQMMPSRDEVVALFDDRRRSEYDFSRAPALVARRGELSGEISDQEQAGFHDVRVSEAPVRGESIYAFEGTKAGA